MTKCKKPTPYDPKLIAERCNPLALWLGCAAGCWKGENFKQCGRPPVAIRRWTRDDGYDDSELLPEEGVYGPACKLHANHDVVPLSEVVTCSRHLTASRSEVGASCSRLVSESVSTGYSRAPHGSRKFFVIVPA